MGDPGTSTRKTGAGKAPLERLVTNGWEFDFFQAVWLLERSADDRVNVGERGPVGGEAIRFRPDVSLGFSPTDIRRITECRDPISDTTYHRVDVTFMGLYGVSTPLPLHYAVDILRSVEQETVSADEENESLVRGVGRDAQEKPESAPVREFLDVLHHRLISLFYRSWLKYRYDCSYALPNRDVITDYLLWLIGCPRGWDEATLGISPIRMLRYAGVLTQRPRSAATLEGTLFDYWGEFPIEVEQCVGRWVSIAPDDLTRSGVANSTLGVDITVGEQVYDLSGAFSISVGPIDWTTYLSFLPDGSRFAQTQALVELYCVDPLTFSMELTLRAGEVPQLRLSSDDEAGRLGFTSWVRTDDLAETSVAFYANSAGRTQRAAAEQTAEAAENEAPSEMMAT